MATTVVLAEDSFIVREGIRMLLEATEGIDLVAAAESYDELRAAAAPSASRSGG